MLKIKCKTLIVSSYDSGFCWSVSIDGQVYNRYDTEKMDDKNPIKMLFESYYGYPYNYDIEYVLKNYFKYKTLIECIDGNIKISHKEKYDDSN